MDIEETPARPQGRRVVIRVARQAGLVALFLVVALLGTLSGVLFAYADDLPEISALDSYQPNTITHLLARDGREIGEYAIELEVLKDKRGGPGWTHVELCRGAAGLR